MRLIAALGTPKDVRHLVELARLAEAACFDAVLIDDCGLEPVAALAAVATATTHIGLIASITTTYNEPYNVARRVLSIDHISEGRAGWNMLTLGNRNETPRFGYDLRLDSTQRDARAAEFYDVVAGLWDSWEDDALLRDKITGDYMDRDKVHFLEHVGAHFKVRGPLNITRSAQGWPVVMQSAVSEVSRVLAARSADLIFIAPTSFAEVKAQYTDLKGRAGQFGRSPLIAWMPRAPDADELADFFTSGAADAFLVESLEDFARDVVPALQRRGLFRTAYTGRTLRQHLDLPAPTNRYTAKRKQA
jgi:N-acetyl-S-(2-succino)cysteine monooxygenase